MSSENVSFTPRTPRHGLRRLFNPRSIAVVGASRDLDSIGGQPIAHLLNQGFAGDIYPVNPKYDELAGLPCYASITDLPNTPDVLVIAVAAKHVADLVTEAGRKGVPFAIIFSSGFAEAGQDGRSAQESLHAAADEAGVTVIGPNCQGLINVADNIPIGFGPPYGQRYNIGTVSVVSQSGAFGNSVLMGLNSEGVGVRHYISTGNEAVTTSLQCIEHFLSDSETTVVSGYLEGYRDAYRLRELGTEALRVDKPLILWKVGNTAAGEKAASSHTANLASGNTYYDAAFQQFGIISVNDVGDMADCVRACVPGRRPKGSGVAVVTISGGAGIVMADRCSELGLSLPDLAPETTEGLAPLLPRFASLSNPVDVTAGALASPESFGAALRVVMDDPGVDMLGLCLAALTGDAATIVAREVAAIAAAHEVPIHIAWNPVDSGSDEAKRILDGAGIPCYSSPVRAARGFGALAHFSAVQRRHNGTEMLSEMSCLSPAPTATRSLNEYESKKLLNNYGLPITQEKVAYDAKEALEKARSLGYPVVMKILSANIPHKSDLGGVRVGLREDDEIRTAYGELESLSSSIDEKIGFEGVLIQEMILKGYEVILGAVNDPSFGPVIMFGAGGVYAEIFEDVSFRLAPLTRDDAEEMIRETRISRILDGARGQYEGDVRALVDALVCLSDLAISEADSFLEIDINPLFVLPKGKGVRVVDAYVRTDSTHG